MSATLAVVEIAQCATCGGVLVPAGDDWRHQEPAPDCTAIGEPVLCRDCAMPAAVGALTCPEHTGASRCPQAIRSQWCTAAV